MLKKSIVVLATLSLISLAGNVLAQSACGGTMMANNDLSSNGRPWGISCCPDGYRVQGIACSDLPPDQDLADGCSAVCRSISKGNIMMPANDFQRQPDPVMCPKQDVMAGIVCKDMNHNSKGDDDVTDSCTPVCQHPGSTALTVMSKGDLNNNGREANQMTVMLPQRVVGIACKDINKGTSDRLDSCSPIVK